MPWRAARPERGVTSPATPGGSATATPVGTVARSRGHSEKPCEAAQVVRRVAGARAGGRLGGRVQEPDLELVERDVECHRREP